MPLESLEMAQGPIVIDMHRPLSIANNQVVISLVIRHSEPSFTTCSHFLAISFNNIFLGDMEGHLGSGDKVHGQLLVVFIGGELVLDDLLLVERVDDSEGRGAGFYGDWEEFGGERVGLPWAVGVGAELERAEEEDDAVDFESVLGPGESGYVLELYALDIVHNMIDFCAFVPTDVQIVILLTIEHVINGCGLYLYLIKGPHQDPIGWLLLFDVHQK